MAFFDFVNAPKFELTNEVTFFDNLNARTFLIILESLLDLCSVSAVRVCLTFAGTNQQNIRGLFHGEIHDTTTLNDICLDVSLASICKIATQAHMLTFNRIYLSF